MELTKITFCCCIGKILGFGFSLLLKQQALLFELTRNIKNNKITVLLSHMSTQVLHDMKVKL